MLAPHRSDPTMVWLVCALKPPVCSLLDMQGIELDLRNIFTDEADAMEYDETPITTAVQPDYLARSVDSVSPNLADRPLARSAGDNLPRPTRRKVPSLPASASSFESLGTRSVQSAGAGMLRQQSLALSSRKTLSIQHAPIVQSATPPYLAHRFLTRQHASVQDPNEDEVGPHATSKILAAHDDQSAKKEIGASFKGVLCSVQVEIVAVRLFLAPSKASKTLIELNQGLCFYYDTLVRSRCDTMTVLECPSLLVNCFASLSSGRMKAMLKQSAAARPHRLSKASDEDDETWIEVAALTLAPKLKHMTAGGSDLRLQKEKQIKFLHRQDYDNEELSVAVKVRSNEGSKAASRRSSKSRGSRHLLTPVHEDSDDSLGLSDASNPYEDFADEPDDGPAMLATNLQSTAFKSAAETKFFDASWAPTLKPLALDEWDGTKLSKARSTRRVQSMRVSFREHPTPVRRHSLPDNSFEAAHSIKLSNGQPLTIPSLKMQLSSPLALPRASTREVAQKQSSSSSKSGYFNHQSSTPEGYVSRQRSNPALDRSLKLKIRAQQRIRERSEEDDNDREPVQSLAGPRRHRSKKRTKKPLPAQDLPTRTPLSLAGHADVALTATALEVAMETTLDQTVVPVPEGTHPALQAAYDAVATDSDATTMSEPPTRRPTPEPQLQASATPHFAPVVGDEEDQSQPDEADAADEPDGADGADDADDADSFVSAESHLVSLDRSAEVAEEFESARSSPSSQQSVVVTEKMVPSPLLDLFEAFGASETADELGRNHFPRNGQASGPVNQQPPFSLPSSPWSSSSPTDVFSPSVSQDMSLDLSHNPESSDFILEVLRREAQTMSMASALHSSASSLEASSDGSDHSRASSDSADASASASENEDDNFQQDPWQRGMPWADDSTSPGAQRQLPQDRRQSGFIRASTLGCWTCVALNLFLHTVFCCRRLARKCCQRFVAQSSLFGLSSCL